MIFTKYGKRVSIEYLFAYDGAIFVFNFYGAATYTDPYDNSVWNWVGTDLGLVEVLAVVDDDAVALTIVASVGDCEALDGSWYWDDANGYLYVHWYDSDGDHSIGREMAIYAKIISGYAAGYHELTQNVFDGVFYRPIIVGLSGLSKKVDPTKLGLISFSESSFSLENHNGEFDDIALGAAVHDGPGHQVASDVADGRELRETPLIVPFVPPAGPGVMHRHVPRLHPGGVDGGGRTVVADYLELAGEVNGRIQEAVRAPFFSRRSSA